MPPQTSYSQSPDIAYAGMIADTSDSRDILSLINATKQLVQITNSTTDGTYTISINGVASASFVGSTSTAAAINADLLADIQASAAPVTAYAVDSTHFNIESNSFVDAFVYAISVITGYTATQILPQGQDIPFGFGVCGDDREAAAMSGRQCRLPRLSADVTAHFLGIALGDRSRQFAANGYASGEVVPVVHHGRIWVAVEGTVTKDQQLYCRYASGSGGTALGAFRTDADSSTAALVPGLWARQARTGAGLVLCERIPNP